MTRNPGSLWYLPGGNFGDVAMSPFCRAGNIVVGRDALLQKQPVAPVPFVYRLAVSLVV
jgi:hypothetical protein